MIEHFKRTKLVATMGPAITQKLWDFNILEDPKNKDMVKRAYYLMEQAILSGMNVMRLNFSHGTYDEQLIRIKILREVSKKLNRNIAIMLDTKGPEIRVGKMKDEIVKISQGTRITVHTLTPIVGDETNIFVTDSSGKYNMANDVKIGSKILIDDGKLQLLVNFVDVKNGKITATALNNHEISEKRRINLPNSEYTMPFLSEKDRQDLIFACEHQLDYIAASFVNSAKDVKAIRQVLDENGGKNIQIVSKIESTNAISNIDEIIEVSDAIMVARGDLALEIPYFDVPYWEKYMIRTCRFKAKPVIVATQMLDSLERNLQPTRAEVTDVFFAVERGADSTMLSGESAKGMYPINAIDVMGEIDKKSEILFDYNRAINVYFQKDLFSKQVASTAKKIAELLKPDGERLTPDFKHDFVAIFTNDKELIRAISNIRAAATFIMVTDKRENINAFAIHYGIQTFYVEDLRKAEKDYKKIALQAANNLKANAKIAIWMDGQLKEIK